MAMEDSTDGKRKRDRVDSGSDPDEFEPKLSRLYSSDSVSDSAEFDRFESDPDDAGVRSPEAKRIQEHLFNMLEEADAGSDTDPAIQGLDSFIRSFEEEIMFPAPASEIISDSGESRPDLGYLLGASDDELGLPPSFPSGTEQEIETASPAAEEGLETAGFGEMVGFDDLIPSYDSFEFGFGGGDSPENNQNGNDFVAVGSLFDHTKNCEPLDVPESLSAV